eukprot:gb/GECH01014236.1/.p1 GENE.gb/GECH01014236.1/~~gb/GECH01014236.1/.p1  ORF type:complete len:568 (+),score=101.51 gb/GECH01014236.1/:1-1704(+)
MAALYYSNNRTQHSSKNMNGNNEQVLSDQQQSVDDRLDPLRSVFTSNRSQFGFTDSDTLCTPSPDSEDAFGSGFMGAFPPDPSPSQNDAYRSSERKNNKKQTHKNVKPKNQRPPPSPTTMIRTIKNKFRRLPELPSSLPKLGPDVLKRIKENEANKRSGKNQRSYHEHNKGTAEKRPAHQRPFAEKRPALNRHSPSDHPTEEKKRTPLAQDLTQLPSQKQKPKKGKNRTSASPISNEENENIDQDLKNQSSAANNNARHEVRRRRSASDVKENQNLRTSTKRSRSTPPSDSRPSKRQRTEYNNPTANDGSSDTMGFNLEKPVSVSVQTEFDDENNNNNGTRHVNRKHSIQWSCSSDVFKKQLKGISSLKHRADEHRKSQPMLACQEYSCTVKRYLYLAAFCTDMDISFLQSLFSFTKWTADFINSHYEDRRLAGLCYVACAAFGIKMFNKRQESTSEHQLSECMSAIREAKNKTSTPSPQASSPDTPQQSPGSTINSSDFPFSKIEPMLKLVEILSITMSSMKKFNRLLPKEWLPTPIDGKVFGCTLPEVFDFAEDKFTEFEPSHQS